MSTRICPSSKAQVDIVKGCPRLRDLDLSPLVSKGQDEVLHDLNSILHGLSHGDWCQLPSFPWHLHHCATVVMEPSCLGKVFSSRKLSLVLSVTLSLNGLQFTVYVSELERPDLHRLWPQLEQLETWTRPVGLSSC